MIGLSYLSFAMYHEFCNNIPKRRKERKNKHVENRDNLFGCIQSLNWPLHLAPTDKYLDKKYTAILQYTKHNKYHKVYSGVNMSSMLYSPSKANLMTWKTANAASISNDFLNSFSLEYSVLQKNPEMRINNGMWKEKMDVFTIMLTEFNIPGSLSCSVCPNITQKINTVFTVSNFIFLLDFDTEGILDFVSIFICWGI